MSWFCSQCGSPNGDTTPTCQTCGAVAPQASASGQGQGQWQQPQAHPGQAGWGQPGAPQGGWGQAGPQAGWQGGPAPMGAPAPMPARPKKSDNGKLIGCGIAGCLGLVVAGALLLGVVGFLANSGSSSSSGRPTSSGQSGRLQDLLPKKVGKWRAVSSKPLQIEGAVDAMLVKYRAGSQSLEIAAAIFPTETMAKGALKGASDVVRRDTNTVAKPITIRNRDNEIIGEAKQFRTNPEVVCYQIDKWMAVVSGPPGELKDFVSQVPP
jgi:hypothetical protein